MKIPIHFEKCRFGVVKSPATQYHITSNIEKCSASSRNQTEVAVPRSYRHMIDKTRPVTCHGGESAKSSSSRRPRKKSTQNAPKVSTEKARATPKRHGKMRGHVEPRNTIGSERCIRQATINYAASLRSKVRGFGRSPAGMPIMQESLKGPSNKKSEAWLRRYRCLCPSA